MVAELVAVFFNCPCFSFIFLNSHKICITNTGIVFRQYKGVTKEGVIFLPLQLL